MTTAIELLQHYGLVMVFVNVLLAQLGVPLSAYPVLLTPAEDSVGANTQHNAAIANVSIRHLRTMACVGP